VCYKEHMQHGTKSKPARVKAGEPFSYRVPLVLEPTFNAILTVSFRNKASVLTESLEAQLPVLEKRYAKELKAYRAKQRAAA